MNNPRITAAQLEEWEDRRDDLLEQKVWGFEMAVEELCDLLHDLKLERERAERWFKAGVEAENKLADAEARLGRAAEALEEWTHIKAPQIAAIIKLHAPARADWARQILELLAEQEKEQP